MKEKFTNSLKSWPNWLIWTIVSAIVLATASLIIYQKYYRATTVSEEATVESNENDLPATGTTMFDWQKSASVWGGRYGQASVVFQDKIWVIGGKDSEDIPTNDVWSSSDGANWTKVSSDNPWPARSSHQAVVFDNKIWLMGGISLASEELNDVWSSTDGVIWNKVTDAASWPVRADFSSIVFDNKIFVMGGWSATSPQGGDFMHYNDVWSSTDGKSWEQLTADAAWAKRESFSTYVYSNKIFVVGGLASVPQRKFSDIYSSADGKVWTKVGDLPEARGASAVVNADGWIYLIGGYDNDQVFADSLYSKDGGATWMRVYNSGDILSRAFHTAVYFKNKLWLLGGTDFTDDKANDFWSTSIATTK
jgi:N-acetylneuraminic acid mutarotase